MNSYPPMQPDRESCSASSEVKGDYGLVLEDSAKLADYIPALENLVAEAIEPNVFLEPWMLQPAIRNYCNEARPVLILIYRQSQSDTDKHPLLCGFVPLLERTRYRGLPIRNLSIWRYPHSYLSTPLLHRNHVEHCVQALISWFKSQHRYKVLEMPLISASGAFHKTLEHVLQAANMEYASNYYERAMLDSHADSNADEYLANAISNKSKREFRRYQRRLAELGNLSWYEFTGNGPDQWTDEFLQLEASGWKGQAGTAMLSSEVDKEFFTTMIKEASSRQRLMMVALRLNNRPIAMILTLLTRDGGFAFKMAFDEAYSRYSPGALVLMELVRRIHQLPGKHWLDSCADLDNAMANRFFLQRRSMRNVIISKNRTVTSWIVRAYPYLRKIKKVVSG